MRSWLDYWNSDTPIYVNERHKLLHDRRVARDVAGLIPSPEAIVLDYGCGEARSAEDAAARCQTLFLYDGAPGVRERLGERFAGDAKIVALSEDGVAALADESLDMVVANSLSQYLTRDDLIGLLDLWHRKLKPGGRLVIGDVIPPDIGPLTDALALLRFGFEGGFLLAAAGGLVRTFFSDYRRLRNEIGLSTHTENEMLSLIEAAGFSAERHEPNIGHNQARMTFVARRI